MLYSKAWRHAERGGTYEEKGPDCVVGENDGGGHEHGEADDFVEL